MRTRAEVILFLDSLVGSRVPDKLNPLLNGQCVTLIKALIEFLGVNKPYAPRGDAKDAGNTYIRQGIGVEGRGWLTVCVNPNMAAPYGHIWVDLLNLQNYESNGAKALTVTKGTRPITQARQFVNFDQWIKEEEEMVTESQLSVLYRFYLGTGISEYGYKERLGKQTFDQAQKGIMESDAFKKVVEQAKSGQVPLKNLPEAVRKVFNQ